jgi:hypothetical protein
VIPLAALLRAREGLPAVPDIAASSASVSGAVAAATAAPMPKTMPKTMPATAAGILP